MDRTSRHSDIVNNMNDYFYHILGCGAIGSSAALQLARMGAENFALYDMDKVETINIGVSQYNIDDVGMDKTIALGNKLNKISPHCSIVVKNNLFDNYIFSFSQNLNK